MSLPTSFPTISTYQYSCSDESQRFPVHNPATGAVITTVQAGNAFSAHEAVATAKNAFEHDWRHRPPAERGALLLQCAAVLETHTDELATLLCLENGKPFRDARDFDCRFLPAVFRYFGSLVDKLPAASYDRGAFNASVIREPHGVCAGILPFNWPPIHTGGKAAPALAAGNVIIIKPGEQAPLTCLRIVELLASVLPAGVVQAVPGLGPDVPQALVKHPDVRMVSFTGSTAAGMAVSATAAPLLKPVQLELGGKNPMLVFDDADLDRAARAAVDGAFFNKGEACTATSRLLVQAGVHDAFIERLTGAVRRLRAGDGFDDGTHVGPLVSEVQRIKVQSWIARGQRDGATLAAQGILPEGETAKAGYFVAPTLLTGVTRDMEIAREEVFGPVLTVCEFQTEEESISIANETRYGLTASVFTKDAEKANRVSRRLEAGLVFVNNYARNVLGLPFGGVKHSGNGREHTIETLNEWSTAKMIQTPSGLGPPPKNWRAVEAVFSDP